MKKTSTSTSIHNAATTRKSSAISTTDNRRSRSRTVLVGLLAARPKKAKPSFSLEQTKQPWTCQVCSAENGPDAGDRAGNDHCRICHRAKKPAWLFVTAVHLQVQTKALVSQLTKPTAKLIACVLLE